MRGIGTRGWRSALATALLVLLVVALLASCGASARPSVAAKPTATFTSLASQVDAYFAQHLAAQRFSGAVLIAQGDRVILSKGYGDADWARQIPNAAQTQFRIGSLTKQFTAAAILLLQARGKLHVGDAICPYLATCQPAWQPITIAELLTHTSGIPNLADDDIADYIQPLTTEQLLALIRAKPLEFTPGTSFSYSNAGYNVLGAIVEHVSGKPYAVFLQQEIFDRLGLVHTRYDASQITLPAHATGYTAWQKPATYLDMTLPFAAGGLASTVGDLYAWTRALDAHTLLGADAVSDMLTAHVAVCSASVHDYCPTGFTALGYGYGWFVGTDALGRVAYHLGDILGFSALIARYPDRALTVIVLSNLETADVAAIQRSLEDIFAGTAGTGA